MNFPRLLIISHNLYDESNNIGKTLVSLLNKWPVDKIAQVFFRNDSPSFNKCNRYFCITDKEVALSVMTLGIHRAGRVLMNDGIESISNTEKNLYRFGNKRIPVISLLRDTMWGIGTWKNEKLRCWVEQYNPEIILFVPNDYVLAYDVALYIEKHIKKVPLIPYYMDDAFYYDCDTRGIDKIRRVQLRKKAREVHTYAASLFTICKKMSTRYEEQFGISCMDFMNSIKPTFVEPKTLSREKIIFSYIGNLHSNRWRCLADIGEAIQQIIEENKHSLNCELHIYSASDLAEKKLSILHSIPCIKFKGRLSPSEVAEKQREADILIHVEAFDVRSRNSTKYSLSTKIPEYLNAGVCIFAYGPSDLASMEYLKENEVAFTCYEKNKLKQVLESAISNRELRDYYSSRGIELAKNNHDIEDVSKRFVSEILRCVNLDVKRT